MKTKSFYIAGALLAAAMLTGCTDNFDNINTDPTGITEGSPAYLMPYIQQKGTHVDSWQYQVGDNLHTNLYAQYFANTAAYFNSDSYTYNNTWVTDGFWSSYYVDVLKQARAAQTEAEKNPAYTCINQTIKIFTARCTALTTDVFGDVPYFEAAKGNDGVHYDSQKDIYADIFKQLKGAVDTLNMLKDDAEQMRYKTNQDLIYDGDFDKWIRLGNSLRLRYALRLAYVDPATAKSEGEAALSATGGLMASNDDNAGVYITGTGQNGWPLFQICGWGEFSMSKTMENMLKQTSTVLDPRTSLWFGHTEGSTASAPEYVGVPNGVAADQLGNYADKSYTWGLEYGPEWNTANDKSTWTFVLSHRQKVMDYSEVCFLKAEAALRGWNGAGSAEANYLAGIQASFDAERANVPDNFKSAYTTADDETYKTTGSAAWSSETTEEGHLKQIITQKWLALFPDGAEAWTEFRRTGYPVLTPVQVTLNSSLPQGTFVKKLRYTDDELRDNPNASSSSLNNGKGDGMNVRVWWDTGRYE